MGCKGDGFHDAPGGRVVSSQAQPTELTPGQRMRVTALGLLRALATMVVLIALYYLLPLDHDKNVPVTLIAGLLVLLAVTAWQLRKVIHHPHPPVRAIEALATTVPLFLLLFAWAYRRCHRPGLRPGQRGHQPGWHLPLGRCQGRGIAGSVGGAAGRIRIH